MPENETDAPGMPRWVKVFGIVALVVIVVVVVVLVAGRGGHGPSRHTLGADITAAADARAYGARESAHT